MSFYNPNVKPGVLEVFCGPMKSGKSLALMHRVEKLRYMKNTRFLIVKPRIDTRDPESMRSRFHSLTEECIFVDAQHPEELFAYLTPEMGVVAIDEGQFFGEKIVPVVERLMGMQKNVVVAGLDTDFRGEPFGQMPKLLCLADEVHKLHGICDFDNCSRPASRTQRMLGTQPAPYNSPVIWVRGDENYQCRCAEHHDVPGAPKIELHSVSQIVQKKLE